MTTTAWSGTRTPAEAGAAAIPTRLVEARSVGRRFGQRAVLRDVTVQVDAGQIHCLIGPNGAGKTTLLRVLCGLTLPTSGTVQIAGSSPTDKRCRQLIGWIPPGDRSFYLRLSGHENLLFFARLHGLGRRESIRRSQELLDCLGLTEAAKMRVGLYSRGMQKRLAVARGLITDPRVLLFDEATHDLDPAGADLVRDLTRQLIDEGKAAVWATQRLDELKGFADTVTVLGDGRDRFSGPVSELVTHAEMRHYRLRLANAVDGAVPRVEALRGAVDGVAAVEQSAHGNDDEFVLSLSTDVILGDALALLRTGGIHVLSCSEERSDVEQAFRSLSGRVAG